MQKGQVAKPLSPDEKLRNQLFEGAVKKHWAQLLRTVIAEVDAATGSTSDTVHEEAMDKRKKAFMNKGVNKLAFYVEEDARKTLESARAVTYVNSAFWHPMCYNQMLIIVLQHG
jgi:hypothetical protein